MIAAALKCSVKWQLNFLIDLLGYNNNRNSQPAVASHPNATCRELKKDSILFFLFALALSTSYNHFQDTCNLASSRQCHILMTGTVLYKDSFDFPPFFYVLRHCLVKPSFRYCQYWPPAVTSDKIESNEINPCTIHPLFITPVSAHHVCKKRNCSLAPASSQHVRRLEIHDSTSPCNS